MAVDVRLTGMPDSDVAQLVVQFNALNADVTAIRDQLAALTTVTASALPGVSTAVLYQPLGNPGFAIATNFDVKNVNAISYINNGITKSLSANTVFDTGTATTIPPGTWAGALLSVDVSGTAVLAWTGAGFGTEQAVLDIIADGSVATSTVLGYVTVQAGAGVWTAGTDALAGGTGGTPAAVTHYYNSGLIPGTMFPVATDDAGFTPPPTVTSETIAVDGVVVVE